MHVGLVSKHLLEEFRSPLKDDADGSLWFVSGLMKEVNDLIVSSGKNFSRMDFQAVNTIKTVVSFVMELLFSSDRQQLQKCANYIAKEEELVSTLLLILEGHGRKSLYYDMHACMNIVGT